MDEFCGSTFWDLNRTWNTDDPDFTPCFEDTSEGYNVFPVAIYTPIIKIATYILALLLLHFSRTRGVQSSGVQFLFWFLLVICETFTFRTVIRSRSMPNPEERLPFIVHMIYYPLIVGQFLINCWADMRPEFEQNPTKLKDRPCPEVGSSYLNRVLFSWVVVPQFDASYKRSLERTQRNAEAKAASYTKTDNSVEFRKKPEKQVTSILPALFGAFGGTFFFGASLKIIPDVLAFVSPQILNALIDYITVGGDPWKGYFLALFLCPMLRKRSQQ
ncbi:unnamed protein product [Allacma fusca]|uniref:Uncharacterized protein n=1 Tax=Allacma fusca TaxID=39272 RepID=A0A8J2LJI6_9HEXA|nr:unnamed protein product [Allacma fusca]